MEIPRLTKGPITVRHLAMFAAATAEFVDIHYDRDFAKSRGLPDVIIQGWYKTAIIAQMLKDWIGDDTAIKRINVQHRDMDVAGNTLTTGGKITSVSQKGNERQVECEVWVENQHSQRTAIGTASLIL